MSRRLPHGGLYALLDAATTPLDHRAELAAQAVAGGAVLLQYRDKSDNAALRRRSAAAILEAIKPVPLLINDDVELAARIGAAGVHLGRNDARIGTARHSLGENAVIGATCHARLDYAEQAIAAGADYVSFGRFFPSHTKPDAPSAEIVVLTQARARLRVPIVAIGGINADNGAQLLAAGADFLAVAGGIFAQPDCAAAARELANLFKG